MSPLRLLRSSPLRFRVTSKSVIALVAALLLILFLFRPGVYRLRNRIATSIGSALGRRVSIDNVRLHLLPRPGFDLEGLVIYDDPQFSAEPMIRAPEVSAAIRFSSLLRGRLEIAALSASDPSINLVRNIDVRNSDASGDRGLWNFASLIERNAQIPAAPTRKPASERRPAFPYLEASNARINFKFGPIKKSYALVNADVAFWQDSENSWGARLRAEPVRTDFNLTDTGLIQINAAWERAASLRSTPLQVTMQWRNGQLGQLTKLFTGKDGGWRGGIDLTATLSGTPEALHIESAATIDGFHRYDIVGTESERLSTTCSSTYHATTRSLNSVLCESPVGEGLLRLSGDVDLATRSPDYDLTLQAQKVPLTSVVRFLRQAKQQLPADLTADGTLNAEFHSARTPTLSRKTKFAALPGSAYSATQTWTGAGVATNVQFLWNSGNDQANLGTIPLALASDSAVPAPRSPFQQISKPPRARKHSDFRAPPEAPPEIRLLIGPAALAINGSPPADVGGWISKTGYRFFLHGDTGLKDIFLLENVLALPVTHPAAEGDATLDVSVSGPWRGFTPATIAGTAQLRNVSARIHGLNVPIAIASASVNLTPDLVVMDKISAAIGVSRWSGQVTAPRHCALSASPPVLFAPAIPTCVFQFNLAIDRISTANLNQWFAHHPASRPWYNILSPSSDAADDSRAPSLLLALQAHGALHVGQFAVKKLSVAQIATQVEIDRGKINLNTIHAQLLRGTYDGNLTLDLSHRDATTANEPPVLYRASGTLQDISLVDWATLMNDAWITGTGEGKFVMEGSAATIRELLTHSDGQLQFLMRNGSLSHIEIPGAPAPLPVHRFAGELHLKKTSWELVAGNLESHDGVYRVKGTASLVNGLDLQLIRGDQQSWTVTGTLFNPRIIPASQTEAQRTEEEKSAKP